MHINSPNVTVEVDHKVLHHLGHGHRSPGDSTLRLNKAVGVRGWRWGGAISLRSLFTSNECKRTSNPASMAC